MPIPFILGAAAVLAGVTGVGAGAYGAKKMYDAKETMDLAKSIYDDSIASVENQNKKTCGIMDRLGYFELEILKSFELFSDLLEKIQNRPEFADIQVGNYSIPQFTADRLKEVSVGAATVITGITGLGLGVAGGVAATGATTAAVMAFATASTGTAISSLSGVAATNAALAFLGGGAISAGGGGMALGATLLSASTLGVGLLVGGAIFAFSGSKMTDKADDAYEQAKKVQVESKKICDRLNEISKAGMNFYTSLENVNNIYIKYIEKLQDIVNKQHKTDWLLYSEQEKNAVKNASLLVGILYNMCKVPLTQDDPENSKMKIVNYAEVNSAVAKADKAVASVL